MGGFPENIGVAEHRDGKDVTVLRLDGQFRANQRLGKAHEIAAAWNRGEEAVTGGLRFPVPAPDAEDGLSAFARGWMESSPVASLVARGRVHYAKLNDCTLYGEGVHAFGEGVAAAASGKEIEERGFDTRRDREARREGYEWAREQLAGAAPAEAEAELAHA